MPTQISNILDTYDVPTNREDLANMVSLISPEETPFYSLIGDETTKSVKTEWSVDELATPSDNAHLEGEVYEFSAVDVPDRVANYCQIFSKRFTISETQEAVETAGIKSSTTYEKLKQGKEMRLDMERAFLANQASVAGNGATARRTAGLRAWCETNDSFGDTGASGGYNDGTGVVDAATNGTQRAFTKDLFDDTIAAVYTAGGNPSIAMGAPYIKREFSKFMSDANVSAFRHQTDGTKQGTIVAAADTYVSDFGEVTFVPNRQMGRSGADIARNVFLIEPAKAKKRWLRKIKEDKDVAKTGDGKFCVMNAEVALKIENEQAFGVIADCFGLSATT